MRRMKGAAIAVTVGLLAAACSSSGHKGSQATPSAGQSSSAPSCEYARNDGQCSRDRTGRQRTGHRRARECGAGGLQAGRHGHHLQRAGATWTCQFNPFNPAVNGQANGFVYEPLVYVNSLKAGPRRRCWRRATQWSSDQKSIVFTIRDGVKWSDGQPLTAADVAFTFNLLKKDSALDLYSLWTGAGLQSAVASGNQVTLTFAQAAKVYFYLFADQVTIVPQHIWSTGDAAAKPDTWADPNPVGSGPFTVNPCTPNNITYKANPTLLADGQAVHPDRAVPGVPRQRAGQPRPRQRQGSMGRPIHPEHRHGVQVEERRATTTGSRRRRTSRSCPTSTLRTKRRSTLAVRQAIAAALDRTQISKIGESGYQPAANQTGDRDSDVPEVLRRRRTRLRRGTTSRTPRRRFSCSQRLATRRPSR